MEPRHDTVDRPPSVPPIRSLTTANVSISEPSVFKNFTPSTTNKLDEGDGCKLDGVNMEARSMMGSRRRKLGKRQGVDNKGMCQARSDNSIADAHRDPSQTSVGGNGTEEDSKCRNGQSQKHKSKLPAEVSELQESSESGVNSLAHKSERCLKRSREDDEGSGQAGIKGVNRMCLDPGHVTVGRRAAKHKLTVQSAQILPTVKPASVSYLRGEAGMGPQKRRSSRLRECSSSSQPSERQATKRSGRKRNRSPKIRTAAEVVPKVNSAPTATPGTGQVKPKVLVKTTRSGRKSAPVLDWWRSQRLSHTPDGNVVVSVGSSQDELFHEDSMATSFALCTTDPLTRECDAIPCRTSMINNSRWTQAQLSMLKMAQVGINPGDADFWEHVARQVGGKDAYACQEKWFESLSTPKQQKKKGQPKRPANDPSSSSSKQSVGVSQGSPPQKTLKGDSSLDDLFNATPSQKRDRAILKSSARVKSTGARAVAKPHQASKAKRGGGREGDVSKSYVEHVTKKFQKARREHSLVLNACAPSNDSPGGAPAVLRKMSAVAKSGDYKINASVSSNGIVKVTASGEIDCGSSPCVNYRYLNSGDEESD
ncbi:unnamed protein product [Choristocarpus tenellus]